MQKCKIHIFIQQVAKEGRSAHAWHCWTGAQIPRGRRTYLNRFNSTFFVSLLYLTVQGTQKICSLPSWML